MNKKYIITAIFLLVLSCSVKTGKGQRFLGAMSLGVNMTQVDGDDYFGFHNFGLNVGPMVSMPFGNNENWSVSLELLYSQKGSRHNSSVDSLNYKLVQDYAEIPVLVHFTDKKIISGGIGFAYGQLINYKETKNDFFDSLYLNQTSPANNEISILGDLQIRLFSKMWLDLRYQYSLRSNRTVVIDDPSVYPRKLVTRNQYNNVISLRLTWVFNQPKIARQKKKASTGDY